MLAALVDLDLDQRLGLEAPGFIAAGYIRGAIKGQEVCQI